MRARQQRYLAEVVSAQQKRLERLLAAPGVDGTAEETRALLREALQGLAEVERVLNRTASRHPRLNLRRAARSTRSVVVRIPRFALVRARAGVRAPLTFVRRRLR